LLIFSSSTAVLVGAVRRMRSGRESMLVTFGLAAVTSILISFHALSYDLTLLLPVALMLLCQAVSAEGRKIDRATILLVVLLFLTPFYVFLLFTVDRFFWFSLILLWIYLRLVLAPVLGDTLGANCADLPRLTAGG